MTETTEERRLAAIMFTDIVGYTTLTQENEAAALALLQDHAGMIRPLFSENGGREVKMIGDSFLVEFSSALSAVKCAVDIQRRLYERNIADQARKIELRIGIHVGDIVYKGSDVFGDAVNIASRIEPLASPGGICISQQVYDQVWNKIEHPIAGLGKRDLKNVQLLMEVYRIVLPWEKEAIGGEGKRVVPLVDRVAELRQLKMLLEKSIQGEGSLAFIAGEAGIGKTRIAEELVAFSRQKNATVLLGRCSRREGKTPYAPWIDQVRDFVRNSPPQLLFKVVGNHGAEIAKLVPEISSVLGPLNSISTGSADQDRLRFIDGVTQFLINVAREAPVLLVVDDMNWADSGSLDIMMSVARQARNNRILIVGIYRDVEVEEDSDLFEFLYDVKREKLGDMVSLKGFDAEDTGRMLAEILNQKEVDLEFRDLVHQKTGGNPFFIEELVRSLMEQGVVFRTAKGWERKPISEIEIPTGVRTVIKQRLSNLDSESQGVLAVAAVTSCESKEFSFALLQSVTGVEEDHLVDVMERILKSRLIKEAKLSGGHPGFTFTDTRVRDAIYDEITQLRRSRYHMKTAKAIEELYKDDLEEAYGVLVYHYLRGNDQKKCLDYALKAAKASSLVYAHPEAIKYLKTALEVLEDSSDRATKGKVLEELGDYCWFAGRPDFAKYSEEAAKLSGAGGEKRVAARLYRELATRLFDSNRDNFSTPNEYYHMAEELLRGDGESAELAYQYHSLARFYFLTGKLAEASELGKKALLLAEKLGVPEVQAQAYLTIAVVASSSEKEMKFDYMKRALEIGLKNNFSDVVFRAYNNMAVEAVSPLDTLRYASEGEEYFKKIGYAPYEENFKLNRAQTLITLGDLEKGRQIAEELLATASLPLARREALATLAYCLGMQGKFDESEQHMLKLLAAVEGSQDFQYVILSRQWLGGLYLEKGDFAKSLEHLNKALSLSREMGLESRSTYATGVANLYGSLVELAIRLGNLEEAKGYLAQAKIIAKQTQRQDTEAALNQAEGMLLAAQNDYSGAKKSLQLSIEGFRKLVSPFLLAKSLYELGVMSEREGEKEEARRSLDEAVGIYKKMGAKTYVDRVQSVIAKL